MAWYRAGTVTVSNGSNVVTGTGTQWANNVHVGDAIVLGSPPQLYEVANVASNTTIGLVTNYTGTSGSGQAYFILATQGWIKELADRAATVIATYASIEQAVQDLELITTLISQSDAQAGTRTDVQGWSSLRVRQAANSAITERFGGNSGNLGSAAFTTMTNSRLDTAGERTIKRNDFGIGRTEFNDRPIISASNAPLAAGFYAIVGAEQSGAPFNYGGMVSVPFSNASGFSIAGSTNTNVISWCRTSEGVWIELHHDRNSLKLGTTPEAARTTIKSSVFPSYAIAGVPPAASNANMGIIVTNATGGRRPFWSDGTNWRDATGTILS